MNYLRRAGFSSAEACAFLQPLWNLRERRMCSHHRRRNSDQGGAAEVEPLRSVAFNDVMAEINRPDQMVSLSAQEKLIKALA